MRKIILTMIMMILFAGTAYAEDALPISGNFLVNYSARTTDNDDYLIGEERLQLEFSKDTSDPVNSSFFLKIDFINDDLANEAGGDGDSSDIDTREGYITLVFDKIDFKVGRQITTWGVGDLLFINDVFPKDWTSLIAGRPLEYLKIGTDSIKAGLYSRIVNAELIVTPFFEEDSLPDGQRLYAYSPTMPANINANRKELPDNDLSNSEVSLKMSQYIMDTDVALYAHRTYSRTPHMRYEGDTAVIFYPKLAIYGVTVQRALLAGLAKFEYGYYQSREDESGADATIKNSEHRYLIAYDKELFTEFNVGVQYYAETMEEYGAYKDNLPAAEPKRDKTRQVTTLRLTKFMMYQTLRLSLFSLYSPSDKDYYVNPEVKYNITDSLYAALGVSVFGGNDNHTMYGQFDGNDNAYTQLRYTF
ncbi:hypothetical protein ACFL2A_04000 [Thermodesulfobacteriota bacterium]